jgi:hypothetical protein
MLGASVSVDVRFNATHCLCGSLLGLLYDCTVPDQRCEPPMVSNTSTAATAQSAFAADEANRIYLAQP